MSGPDQRPKPLPPPRPADSIDGVLIVDKPSGPTSHDVVAAIRRKFGFKKVGHGGTLDPQATGLLVILIGKATKISNLFMGSDKTYAGSMRLGISTDSQDAQGKVIKEADFSSVTREQVEARMAKQTGDMLQTPPMVSAVKVDGVPLYKKARKGQVVERESKLIHVYEFSLKEFNPPGVGFLLRCTKGTYARTLCADLGDALGCGAHLAQLRRTVSGNLRIEDSIPLDEILGMSRDEVVRRLIPITRFSTYNTSPSSSPCLRELRGNILK